MSVINTTNHSQNTKQVPFNWPVVSCLLFITGIPAIPAIFILVMILIGSPSEGGFSSIVNALYFDAPLAIFVHGGTGILFFLTMPFQFSPALRVQKANWHKVGGRIALTSGYVMAISAIWMHHVLSANDFGMRYLSLVLMSIAMCAAYSLALWHIVNRNVIDHRKWMIRSVAITLAAITPLFVETLISLLFGHFESMVTVLYELHHDYGRLFAIGVNLLIVELFIVNKVNQVNSGD